MLVPSPIVLSSGTWLLEVSGERGGLSGYYLLGQSGPPVIVEQGQGDGWAPLPLPARLSTGMRLRLRREGSGPALSTIHALAPLDELPPPTLGGAAFTLARSPDGRFETIEGAEALPAADPRFEVVQGAKATPAADPRFETLERS